MEIGGEIDNAGTIGSIETLANAAEAVDLPFTLLWGHWDAQWHGEPQYRHR